MIQQLETICIYVLMKLITSGVHSSVYHNVLDVSGQYEELFLLQVLREAVKNRTLSILHTFPCLICELKCVNSALYM